MKGPSPLPSGGVPSSLPFLFVEVSAKHGLVSSAGSVEMTSKTKNKVVVQTAAFHH